MYYIAINPNWLCN